MTHAPADKVFALGISDSEENSFSQHSVSRDLGKLSTAVDNIFLDQKDNGVIREDAVLTRSAAVPEIFNPVEFHYKDEDGESVLFAKIEIVNFL